MAVSEYGDISQRTAAWAATKALKHNEPIIVLNKFGQVKPLPKNKANGVKFRRAVPNTVSVTPLTEGVTPASKKIVYEDVAVTLTQHGDLAELTDVVHDTSEDPVLSDMMELAGEQAVETSEMVTYGVLKGGTSVIYNNGTARNQVNTVLTLNAVRLAVRSLNAQRAKRITKIVGPSVLIDTRAVEAAYVALCHTDLDADIRSLGGFVPVSKYGSMKPLCDEELGVVENVRFITSPLLVPFEDAGGAHGDVVLSTSGVSGDVYPIIIIGKDAFGHVPLKGAKGAGKNFHPMVLNPNTPRGGDELGQRGSVSWKCYLAPLILNQLWMTRIEVGASDLI